MEYSYHEKRGTDVCSSSPTSFLLSFWSSWSVGLFALSSNVVSAACSLLPHHLRASCCDVLPFNVAVCVAGVGGRRWALSPAPSVPEGAPRIMSDDTSSVSERDLRLSSRACQIALTQWEVALSYRQELATNEPDTTSARDDHAAELHRLRIAYQDAVVKECLASYELFKAEEQLLRCGTHDEILVSKKELGEAKAARSAARSALDEQKMRLEYAERLLVVEKGVGALDVSQRRRIVPCSPSRPASDSVASNQGTAGPGALTSFLFDPTPEERVAAALLPDDLEDDPDAELPRLLACDTTQLNMVQTPERAGGSVPAECTVPVIVGRALLANFGADGEVAVEDKELALSGVPTLLPNNSSRPDFTTGFCLDGSMSSFVPCRIREFKSSSKSCVEVLPQAFCAASAVCVHLVRAGLKPEDAIVPVDVTAGGQMQFGATFLADGTLPLPLILSGALTIGSRRDALLIERFLSKARVHMDKLRTLLQTAQPLDPPLAPVGFLDIPDSVFVKRHCINMDGMVPGRSALLDETLRSWVVNMYHVFARLYERGLKANVCFPLGHAVNVLLPALENNPSWGMFYPDLSRPSTLNPDGLFNLFPPATACVLELYADALRVFISSLHAALVVHGDLYPSNVLWREASSIVIKVIDWDTAFFLRRNKEAPGTWSIPAQQAQMWENTAKWKGKYKASGDPRDLDLFMVDVLDYVVKEHARSIEDNITSPAWELWTEVACASSTGACNAKFRDLQALYLEALRN